MNCDNIITENQPHIVSVSRRSDVPAFYSQWFLNALKQGFVTYVQPYTKKEITVLLNPDSVAGFVFWSKNYSPFLPHIHQIISRYRCYFHYTITGYGPKIEHYVPELAQSLETFTLLSDVLRPEQIIWRYDPIIISKTITPDMHCRIFRKIAAALENKTKTCVISFVQLYKKIRPTLQTAGIDIIEDIDIHLDLVGVLKQIATEHGIEVEGCCSPELQLAGIMPTACVSQSRFKSLYSDFPLCSQKRATRKHCLCDFCHDIGRYNSCHHNCLYCYAM